MNQLSREKGYLKPLFIIVASFSVLCSVVYAASKLQIFSPPVLPVPVEYKKLLGVETVLWDRAIENDIRFADSKNLCRKMYNRVSANGVSMWAGSQDFHVEKGDKVQVYKDLDLEFLTVYRPSGSKYLLPLIRRPIYDIGWRFNTYVHHYEISSSLSSHQADFKKMEYATVWTPKEEFEGEIVLLIRSHPMNSGWRLLKISNDDLPHLLKDGVKNIFQLDKLEDYPDRDVLLHLLELSKQYPFSQK